jgi:ABC-type phosphate transport system substrate-binding protein
MNRLLLGRIAVLMPLLMLAPLTEAGVAVIVNPANAASLSEDDVQRLFLGKTKSFPGGAEATPVDNKTAASREAFNQALLGKNESQVKAYWSQLVFTGKGTPPKELDNDAAVKAFVAANPGAIGYIDAGQVDGSVKAVLTK